MNRNHECFLTIFEEGSFSKAAEQLFVSQPALSLIVRKTEEEIGAMIFNRSYKPIRLTPAGEYYVEYIRKLAEAEQELTTRLNELREREDGTLFIGGSNFFCSYQLPEVFEKFKEKYPKYKMSLTEGNPQYLCQQLQNSALELIVGIETLDPKMYRRQFWKQEYLVLGVSAKHPVNNNPYIKDNRLSFEDIRSGRYLDEKCPTTRLAYFSKLDFYGMNRGNDSYQRAVQMCRKEGFRPNDVMSLDQMMSVYSALKSGNGAAFLRADIMRYTEPTDKLWFYKLNDPLAIRDVYVYYKKTIPLTKPAKQLVKFLKEESNKNEG